MNATNLDGTARALRVSRSTGTHRTARSLLASALLAAIAVTVAGCASSHRTSYEERAGTYYGYNTYYGDGWGRGYHRGYGGGHYGRPRGYRGRW